MKFIINSKPVPLKRYRFTKNGNTYNSQSSYMEDISFFIKYQYDGCLLLKGPLKISIVFYMQIPRSYSKKKKELLNNKYHDIKPDIDNLEKLCYDVICRAGTVFSDDCQIAEVHSTKVWSNNARTEFTVEQIDYEFDKIKFWSKDK